MNSQLSFAVLFLPDLPNALALMPAVIIIALAVCINLVKSVKGTAFFKTPLARVSLVVLAQVMVLGAFQTKYQSVVDGGIPIVLESRPADPYDFFRGYYQNLQFDITILREPGVPFHFSRTPQDGDIAFVTLKRSKDVWVASGVFDQKPKRQDAPFIKGRLRTNPSKTMVTVHYGIEQFFFPDSKPVSIADGALAFVKVDANGDAVLTNLIARKR